MWAKVKGMFITRDTLHPRAPPPPWTPARAPVWIVMTATELAALTLEGTVTLGTSANRKVGSFPGMFFLEVKSPLPSPPLGTAVAHYFLLLFASGSSSSSPWKSRQICHMGESFVNIFDQWLTTLRKDYLCIKCSLNCTLKTQAIFLEYCPNKLITHRSSAFCGVVLTEFSVS